jgi:hypothetical protein
MADVTSPAYGRLSVMLIVRKTLLVAAAMLAAGTVARAQSTSINLQVDVQPTASFLAGNVTRVSYVVANGARSSDRLFEFAVRSPVPVWRLEVPTPQRQYRGAMQEGDTDVASWGWLDAMPRPGESSPVLAYEAIGLPGVVAYRALRYFGVRSAHSADPDGPNELRFDKAGAEYTVGKTVGVVSLPIDLRPSALANRLRRLVDEACELGWVGGPTACQHLRSNARPSARAVRAFHRELVAQRGKAVGEAAFALLAPNAEFLLSKL